MPHYTTSAEPNILEKQKGASKDVEPKIFFERGYIPNVYNLEKENAVAAQLENALKEEIYINKNYEAYKLAHEVFQDNYERLKAITNMREEKRENYLKKYSDIYEMQDEAWLHNHPDYVAPEAPIGATVQSFDVRERVNFLDAFAENSNVRHAERIEEIKAVNKYLQA